MTYGLPALTKVEAGRSYTFYRGFRFNSLVRYADKRLMNTNQKSLLLFVLCCVLSYLVTNPYTRNALLAFRQSDARTVLATIDYHVDDQQYKIVKLGVGQDIYVEIYRLATDTGRSTIASVFTLPYSRDTFFSTENSMSNLFLSNLDDDENHEIIVPILDENLVSHLTVIKYDKDSMSFSHHDYIGPHFQ